MTRDQARWFGSLIIAAVLFPEGSFASHEITFFRSNRKGAVSITFDDGYPSQVANALPLLNSRHLKGTFFVVTDPNWISSHVSWEEWRTAAGQGHEIGSSTVHHPYLTTLPDMDLRWELGESLRMISEKIPFQTSVPFVYPYGDLNTEVQEVVKDYYPWAKGTHAPEGGFLNYYRDGPGGEAVDFLNIGSLEILPETTLSSIDHYLDLAETQNAWFCVHFYEVRDPDFFSRFLDRLLERNLWVDTLGTIARYMRGRQTAQLSIVAENSTEIRLQLAHGLDPLIYRTPLTLRSVVPSHWKEAVVEQGDSITVVTSRDEDDGTVIYYDALPNGEEILLSNSAMVRKLLYVASNKNTRVDRKESIARIDIASGETTYFLPTYHDMSNPGGWANPEGITFVGQRLFVAGFEPGVDGRNLIWELDPLTGREIRSFLCGEGKPTGLTNDGTYLYAAQNMGRKSRISKFSLSGQRIQTFELSVDLRGVAYGRGFLFGVNENRLYTINPSAETVVAAHTLPMGNVSGLDFLDGVNPSLLASFRRSPQIRRIGLAPDLALDGTFELYYTVPEAYHSSVAFTVRR